MLNNLDLNKLRVLSIVEQRQSLKESSEQLKVSASAIHQSIKKLEEQLRFPLFYRSGKKYLATARCEELLKIYRGFEQSFEEEINKERGGSKLAGTIRCGMPLNFSKTEFGRAIKTFMQEQPNVSFDISTGESGQIIEKIMQFKLDFAIIDERDLEKNQTKLSINSLTKELLVLVTSNHFAKQVQGHDFKAIRELSHITYAKNCSVTQRWYRRHFKRNPKELQGHIVDNVETALSLVRHDLGVAVVPLVLVEKGIKNKELVILGPKDQFLENRFLLVQNLDFIPSLLIKEFLIQFQQRF
jgi:DNA-binding transcriptional LysR family regulator